MGNACSGYDCSDGKSGNGHCSCSDPHVTGTACEICKPGFYGKGCAQRKLVEACITRFSFYKNIFKRTTRFIWVKIRLTLDN